MALANYTDLVTSIANWSHRTDLTSEMDNFIRLAEDVIYGDLEIKPQETIANLSTVASVETVSLPNDFMEMKSLSITSSSPNSTLKFYDIAEYENHFQFNNTGKPYAYAIINNTLYLQNIPDAVYTLRAVYVAQVPNLTATAPTNHLLTAYPTLYLYSCLVQFCLYAKKDPSTWQTAYNKVLKGINDKDWSSASPLTVKHDVNTYNSKL